MPDAVHREHYAWLVSLAKGLPVAFHPNATPAALAFILARAHIYVHASGYGADADRNPHVCEHFGISVLEAMSYGLAPFVVANGGPTGFVFNGRTGYTYETLDELVTKIQAALGAPDELDAVRQAAITLSANYDEQVFREAWRTLARALLR